MQAAEWEIDGVTEEYEKTQVRKRNDAFRRRIRHELAERRRHHLRLYLATGLAVASWVFAALQLLR